MTDEKEKLKEGGLKARLNLPVWLARLRLASGIAVSFILGAGILWLFFYFSPAAPPVLIANDANDANELSEKFEQELAQELAKLRSDHEEALSRLSDTLSETLSDTLLNEMRDDVRVFLQKARKDMDSLSRRVGVMERDLDLRPSPGAIALASELEDLKRTWAKDLARLDRRVDHPSGSEFALLGLALSSLKRAASGGGAFEIERRALKALLPGEKILDAIESMAREGVQPRSVLAREFDQVAHRARALQYEGGGHEGGGLSSWLWFYVLRLADIRPLGGQPGSAPSAILSRMEAQVRRGDFTRTLSLAGELKANRDERAASMHKLLNPWLEQVRQRLFLDGRLLRLDIKISAFLSEIIRKENRESGKSKDRRAP